MDKCPAPIAHGPDRGPTGDRGRELSSLLAASYSDTMLRACCETLLATSVRIPDHPRRLTLIVVVRLLSWRLRGESLAGLCHVREGCFFWRTNGNPMGTEFFGPTGLARPVLGPQLINCGFSKASWTALRWRFFFEALAIPGMTRAFVLAIDSGPGSPQSFQGLADRLDVTGNLHPSKNVRDFSRRIDQEGRPLDPQELPPVQRLFLPDPVLLANPGFRVG